MTARARFEREFGREYAHRAALTMVSASITRPLLLTGGRGPHEWAGLELCYAPLPSLSVCDGCLERYIEFCVFLSKYMYRAASPRKTSRTRAETALTMVSAAITRPLLGGGSHHPYQQTQYDHGYAPVMPLPVCEHSDLKYPGKCNFLPHIRCTWPAQTARGPDGSARNCTNNG